MQSVQRHFGKYMKRTADHQQVSLLLKDFEDADQLLAKLVEEAKRWRESWLSILTFQHRLFNEFELMYAPILGAGEDYQGHVPVETPEHLVARTSRITTECDDLKKDLRGVLEQVDYMMIKPAQDARDNLQILRKTIKKREDKKLDFERYQGRVDTFLKKKNRSDRDNQVLAKAESELAVSKESYKAADDHLLDTLPPVLQAVYSLQPHLLAAQVNIQNSLLGHYYTSLHTYCTQEGFPSPAPAMDEVIRLWDDSLRPIQKEFESIGVLASGKAVRKALENGHSTHGSTNGYRRPSQNSSNSRVPSVSPARPLVPSISNEVRPRIASSPSTTSVLSIPLGTPSEHLVTSPSPGHSAYASPSANSVSYAPAGPNIDYFSRDRQTTTTTNTNTNASTTSTASTPGITAGIAAAKKRPPPPPPRMNSHQHSFVTALYDFNGQSDGDLVFREGDKIKVIKKTESVDDWWQGELRGVKGMFPANYCS